MGREVVVLHRRRARLCGGTWSFHTCVCGYVWVCVGVRKTERASERRALRGLPKARPEQNLALCRPAASVLTPQHYSEGPQQAGCFRLPAVAGCQGLLGLPQSRAIQALCAQERKQSRSPASPACAPSSVSKTSFISIIGFHKLQMELRQRHT